MRGCVAFFLASIWLAAVAEAEVRILTCEEPPTNFMEEGELRGMTVEIVRAIRDRLGIYDEIEILPWARAYRIAKREPGVVIFTCAITPERVAHGFHFVGPVTTRRYVLWMKRGAGIGLSDIGEITERGLSLGTVRGDWRAKKRGMV